MSYIFISYSRQDQAYVTLLAQALESHRLPVWLDDRIDYGTTWPRVIQDQLEQCAVFLLVMSPRSENSHWVQCELSMALELKKPVFPLLLEGDRWLAVAALQQVNVVEGKLPPANFFDRLRLYFPGLRQEEAETQRRQQETEAEQKRQAEVTAQRQREEAERQKRAKAEVERHQQEKEATERKLQEATEARRRQQVEAERNRSQPVSPYGDNRLSRQQFLKWAGLGGFGLVAVFSITQLSKNVPLVYYYNQLERLLKAGFWKEADQETRNIMLKIANREEEGWLDQESLQNFPCEALAKIDKLWVEASDGKFGFSVQKNIYVDECGGKPDGQYDEKAWYCFADKVGWRKNGTWLDSEVTFNTTAPIGHLPSAATSLVLWVEYSGVVPMRGQLVGSFLLQTLNCSR